MDSRALAAGVLLWFGFAAPVFAQDDQQGGLGLDLSGGDDKGVGLDLSEPTVPPELRPSVAIFGVTAQPQKPEEEAILKVRAEGVQASLVGAMKGADSYSKVVEPADTRAALGADADKFAACAATDCLDKIAETLDVDRVVVGTIAYAEGETRVTLTGYDRGKKSLFTSTAESQEKAMRRQLSGFAGISGKSQATKDKEFFQKANAAVFEMVGFLKTALGTIDVRSYDTDVVVTLNGKQAGTGAFTKTLAAGEYALHAESPDVLPFDQKVTVESLKTVEVPLSLTAKPKSNVAPVIVEKKSTTPIYTRPGLYVAVAGAVAIGVGAVFGSQAKSIEHRATKDDNGIYNITRTEMQTAKSNALLANILMGVGGAAVAGGTIWMFVAPGTAKAEPVRNGPEEPEGAGGGFTIGAGGTF
ncbi:MAG: hypothetical protein ACJ790_07400 [Myxococcaceae bacterium]